MILIGVGIGVAALAVYTGRKGWHAFHRAVGITPGKVTYLTNGNASANESAQLVNSKLLKPKLLKPRLITLTVDDTAVPYLSADIIGTLRRIDAKATSYRNWHQSIQEAGKEPPYLEDEFVIAKLLDEHLPNIINIYVNYAHIRSHSHNEPDSQMADENVQNNAKEAYETLIALLNDIESRLDNSLIRSEAEQLQQLQVMKRYLDKR